MVSKSWSRHQSIYIVYQWMRHITILYKTISLFYCQERVEMAASERETERFTAWTAIIDTTWDTFKALLLLRMAPETVCLVHSLAVIRIQSNLCVIMQYFPCSHVSYWGSQLTWFIYALTFFILRHKCEISCLVIHC